MSLSITVDTVTKDGGPCPEVIDNLIGMGRGALSIQSDDHVDEGLRVPIVLNLVDVAEVRS